ncbi:dual specificity protein phosphatase CDC14A-like isoform X2 [Leptidea sinapis]|uniref:dual specificity protein phosphatase CDC14A-like isoform X2 n=1 Tax=Leptidea sinapis TaxID=189913 RepID=UPI0021C44646|nr:dual specificity protein phosphatase CDC14A-like isoform X2 [Leptidea sinapis]
MTRNPDILFITEYIKNVLYFATVRHGRTLTNSNDTHYFCVDKELIYENYYSDFGPLNLGCVYKYCIILHEKLKEYLNKQVIVHYTSIDPKKKTNAAYLLGCYGVLYLSLAPKDALKPFYTHGQVYRPFQDASQGDSNYTISLLDCLEAVVTARDLGFFNFQDFDYEEYERLDKIQGGDLNWIVPDKFLAFIGPVDRSVSLFHPPEMYINYFQENNVKIVIRLNKKLYDGNVFNNVGITHYDLYFPDGTCPPRHILLKFLQIAEDSQCGIGVHCKAGLGRTGSLIGSYLIKHYRMTAHEAIAWMRICRPGSVIGQQQEWLEKMEPWLKKQGNLYRKRTYDNINRLPIHEYGVYSLAQKNLRQQPVGSRKPSQPIQRPIRSDTLSTARQQASKTREDSNKTSEKKFEWNVKVRNNQTSTQRRVQSMAGSRPCSGGDDPRALRIAGKCSTARFRDKNTELSKNSTSCPVPTFRTSEGPVIKSVNDAKNFLMRSTIYGDRFKNISSAITVKPPCTYRASVFAHRKEIDLERRTPSSFDTASKYLSQPPNRRKLGRSPSPSPTRMGLEQTRATNTFFNNTNDRPGTRESKSALMEALSRLKLTGTRDGSIGAASLGARRDAPAPSRPAPSVRSDERPLATQGDMLNSIKFQRRWRETLNTEQVCSVKDKPSVRNVPSKVVEGAAVIPRRPSILPGFPSRYYLGSKEQTTPSKGFVTSRPGSPTGRRIQMPFFKNPL